MTAFRENLAERAQEHARQELAHQEALAGERKALMQDVADDFEKSVLSVVSALTQAAGSVEQNSGQLNQAVGSSLQELGDVRRATEDANGFGRDHVRIGRTIVAIAGRASGKMLTRQRMSQVLPLKKRARPTRLSAACLKRDVRSVRLST